MTAVVIDLNDARPQGYFSPRQLDQRDYVRDLKDRMAIHHRSVLQHLWPAGKFVGAEFEVGDVGGAPGRSLKVSCRRDKMGIGRDFAGNETFGDLIDAWAYATRGRPARGRDFAEICDEIEDFLGRPFKPQPKVEKAKARDLPPPSAQFTYTDAAGTPLVVVYRYDLEEQDKRGKPHKEFRPWTVATKEHRAPEQDRPLYNLPGIAKEPFVVLVEGEGKAEALIKAGIPATCAMGGSKAPVEKTDWQPLQGKHVIIWPDADEEGAEFAGKVQAKLSSLCSSVAQVAIPPGKPKGWDAADALAEGLDVRDMLNAAVAKPPPRSSVRTLDLEAWRADAFAGDPKPVQWLVEDVFPLATAGLLVAMGDAGKGILTLDLALKVASPKPEGGMLEDMPRSFGVGVATTGAVVILAAEDDRDEIHRRLHRLDPEGKRAGAPLYVVPLPNAGGPVPIVKTSSTGGPYLTPEWHGLRATLCAISDLRLVVFDPLASFVHADINADPAAGAFVTGTLAALATETGATVLVCHHMSKTSKPVLSPEEARAAIRGSTAIVDGMRFAYALWHVEENEGRRTCAALGTEWQRGRVLKGAVVKSNAPADRAVRTFIRDQKTGLLIDKTERLNGDQRFQKETELETLALVIVDAAAAGYPYTYSSSTGLYERRGEMPEGLANISRARMRELADELMSRGRIVRVRYKGQSSPWLDAPEGDFARGLVELNQGAYKP